MELLLILMHFMLTSECYLLGDMSVNYMYTYSSTCMLQFILGVCMRFDMEVNTYHVIQQQIMLLVFLLSAFVLILFLLHRKMFEKISHNTFNCNKRDILLVYGWALCSFFYFALPGAMTWQSLHPMLWRC